MIPVLEEKGNLGWELVAVVGSLREGTNYQYLAFLKRPIACGFGISKVYNEASWGCEVPLKAFCCKARGGGGRLRHATGREKKEKKQEKEV